jgi:hypothetical protein
MIRLTGFLLISLFFIGCNTDAISDPVVTNDPPSEIAEDVYDDEVGGVWAKENLDLLAVGSLLNESVDGASFEKLLNTDEGVNNLDLNGDGFVDYISVEEFEDRTDDQRGFTLLSRFGPDDVQEIASIIFGRDRPDRRGATLYVRGNDQIYGNNYGYEGNLLDKSLKIARWVFGDRDNYYRSTYYYDNYPDQYTKYRVINTPVYRNRVVKYQVNPAMIKITTPTSKIKIKSRYPGRSYRRVRAKLVKPTREQLAFYKSGSSKPAKQKSKDLQDPDKGPKAKDNGRGKALDKKPQKSGKPGVDKKSGKGSGKGAGKQPVKKNLDKKGGNLGKNGKAKGGGKSKGKGGKP